MRTEWIEIITPERCETIGGALRLLLQSGTIGIRGEVIDMTLCMTILGLFLSPHHIYCIIAEYFPNHLILMSY